MSDEAINLLRECEWAARHGLEGEDPACPICGAEEREYVRDQLDEHGHYPACRLSRLVHGPISPERQAAIAAHGAEMDRQHQEHLAKTPAQRHAETAQSLDSLRRLEQDAWSDYIRNGSVSLPGIMKRA